MRSAATLRAERDHTVDIRVLLHHLRVPEIVGHLTRRRGRAVHRGENGDVIPRPDATVLAAKPHEGAALALRHVLHGAVLGAWGIVEIEPFADREIVAVDMIAGGDVLRGESNDLPVPPDLADLRHFAQCDFMTRRDHLRNANLAA